MAGNRGDGVQTPEDGNEILNRNPSEYNGI